MEIEDKKGNKENIKRRMIGWIILAVVLTGVLIAGIVTNRLFGSRIIGCGVSIGMGNTYANAGKYMIGEFSSEKEIEELEINWRAGSVELSVSEGDKIEVKEDGGLEEEKQLRYLFEGNKLTIQYEKSGIHLFGHDRGKNLTVYIPQKMAENMDDIIISTVSADISAENFNSKNVEFDTVSGEINIESFSAEEFQADSTSGNVIGKKVNMEELEVDTTSGDIRFEGTLKKVEADTTSGKIVFISDTELEEANVDTVSGDIQLKLPKEQEFEMSYDTVSGDFNTDFSVSKKKGNIICGNGDGDFSFDTVSGDLDILYR